MKFKIGRQWIDDRPKITDLIIRLFDESDQTSRFLKTFEEGAVLMSEGELLEDIYLLLEGAVELFKRKPNSETNYPIITLEPGSFIGIIAFTTGEPSLTTAIVQKEAKVLKIPKQEVHQLFEKNERFAAYMDELMLANLLDRFRNTIILQMKLDSANNKLRAERNELRLAYQDLKEAQDKLIYQEKMATLGQLVAGFAHEVNNPTASLLRSAETLEERISGLMVRLDDGSDKNRFLVRLYEAGKKALYPDTSEIRERVKKLTPEFESATAAQLRLLAQIPDHLVAEIKHAYNEQAGLDHFLDHFEMGKMFHNVSSAGRRIAGLVKSLKSYSRTDTEQQWEEADIREGIHDTLQLTSNRIKYYDIELELQDVPNIRVNPAALNQVWTNIILNAADAMGKNGYLSIRCNHDEERIWVEIRDSGPGIPDGIIDKIFDSNFSTKKSDIKFGLGLGLSISRDIVRQHGGTISAKNAPSGGAIFTVSLPLKSEVN